MRKRTLTREAERAIYSIRCFPHLKPLQQRFGLRMIRKYLMPFSNRYGHSCRGQDLHRIASLQVPLTDVRICGLAGELPGGCDVVNERIVERLRGFMRECGYVLESSAENSRRDPTRILGDPAGLRDRARLKEVGMEAKHTAPSGGVRIVDVERKQKGVGEQRHVQPIGCEIAGVDLVHYFVVEEEVKQQIQHQHEGMAVGSGSDEVGPGLNDVTVRETDINKPRYGYSYTVYHLRTQDCVPVLIHAVEELGPLHRICEL